MPYMELTMGLKLAVGGRDLAPLDRLIIKIHMVY